MSAHRRFDAWRATFDPGEGPQGHVRGCPLCTDWEEQLPTDDCICVEIMEELAGDNIGIGM
jgi:hypothetical protein